MNEQLRDADYPTITTMTTLQTTLRSRRPCRIPYDHDGPLHL